ncbi:phage tail tape measure protein [Clostridium sp.]|uniref:phage tail tape measure protein n=1 Tax=Clostridium sp. TaxID=1506 RepID=UPI0035A0EB71
MPGNEDVGKFAVKVAMEDSSFQEGLQNLKRNMAVIDSSFKEGVAGLKDWGKNLDSLQGNASALGEKIEIQRQVVEKYQQQLEKSKSTLENNSKAMMDLKSKVSEAKEAWEESKITLGENTEASAKLKEEYEELKKQYTDSEQKVRNNAKSMDGYTIQVNNATSKLKGLEGQLEETNNKINNFKWASVTSSLEESSKKFESVGIGASKVGDGLLRLSAPLVGVGIAASKVGNDFETSMSQAAGALEKPMTQMGSLRELALKTGQDTQFSATQAGQAITELAKGGLTEAQIKTGALDTTMKLAASSGMQLGNAANTVVQAMGAFGLSATQSAQAVNALAGAAAASSTDVEPLSQGLAQCAAQAHMVGWSIQDTTAVLGEFADAGIVGSDAGTSLKTALQRLGAPTDDAATKMESLSINVWDSNGHMKNASGIAEELQSKMSGLSDAEKQAAMSTIFGSDATRAASILMDKGADGLKKYINATNDQTSASRLAASQMGETSKSIEQMFGSLEIAGIKIQESLAPTIKSVADSVGNLADSFGNLSPGTQKLIVDFAGITLAAGGTLKVFGGLAKSGSSILDFLGKFTGKAAAASAAAGAAATAAEGVAAAEAGAGAAAGVVATGGLGAFASGLGALTLAAAPWIAAAAGVATAGYGIYKAYKTATDQTIPQVDLFADKVEQTSKRVQLAQGQTSQSFQKQTVTISESTRKAVSAYVKLNDSVTKTQQSISINAEKFTTQTKNTVIKNFTDIVNKSTKLDSEMKTNKIKAFTDMVNNTNNLSVKNKTSIVNQYKQMLSQVGNISDEQKNTLVKDFQETLDKSIGITQQQVDGIKSKYDQMTQMVNSAVDERAQKEIKTLQDLFSKSTSVTSQEQQTILNNISKKGEERKQKVSDLENQILTIYQTASNNHRDVTSAEQQLINQLQTDMEQNAVQILSKNELESKVILERLKDYNGNITLEQASDTIQNAEKAREGSVKAAEDQYNQQFATIIQMRDGSHEITADQADKMIAEAKRQRDESITKANDMKEGVVKKVEEMNKDVEENINTSTGRALSPLEKLKKWWEDWIPSPKKFTFQQIVSNIVGKIADGFAEGTDYAPPGWHWVGEEGPELMNFAGGEQVITAKDSKDIMEQMQNGGKTKATNATASTTTQMKSTEQYAENLNTSLGTGITNSINDVVAPLNELINKLNTLMTNFTAKYTEYGEQNVKNLGDGITQSQSTATAPLNDLTEKLGKNLDAFSANALKYGTQTSSNIGDGITDNSGEVIEAGNNITDTLDTNLTKFVSSSGNYGLDTDSNISSGITGNLNMVTGAAETMAKTLDSSLTAFASDAINYGLDSDASIGSGITNNAGAVIGAQSNLTDTLNKNLNTFANNSVNYGLNTDTSIGNGINNNAGAVINAQSNVTTTLGNNLTVFATAATQYGQSTDTSIASGITNTAGSVTGAGNNLTTTLGNNFNTFAQGCTQYGTGVTNSIAEGMKSAEDNAVSIAHELTQKILEAFTGPEGFDIHSPSRKTTQYGENVIQGFINGMSSQDAVAIFKNKIGSMLSAAGTMSGNVAEWIMAGIMAEGAPMSWFLPLEMIASRESGNPGTLGTGDPGLVNNVGVGNEYATGLMQILPSTFRSYFGSDDGIFNPIMSVRAAIKEIEESWGGNPYNIPGLMDGNGYLGYETGTDNATAGVHPVAENGFEIIFNKAMGLFKGGETVLNNSDSIKLLSSIGQLGSNAASWGVDIVQNIASGMNSKLSTIKDAANNIANGIYRILHFSVPDEGSLSDADTYGSDFMQLLADTMNQNSDKPTEAAKKVADLVAQQIKSVKDKLASDTKDLNNQLYNLGQQEDVSLRGVKGAARYSIQDEYEAKKKAIKDEIALRKEQANKEIDEIQKIGKMSKEEIQDELDAKKQAASNIDKLNDVLVKSIERKLNAEKEAAIESANLKAEEEKLTKDQLSNLLEYVNNYYTEKLDKDAIAAQAEQLITSKNQAAIISLLSQYGNLYEDSGLTLGQRLTTGVKSWTDLIPGIVGNAMQNVQTEVQTAAVNVQSTLGNIMQNISTVGAAGAQLAGVDTSSFDDIFSKWKDSGMGSLDIEEDPVKEIENKYKDAFNEIELAMIKLGKDTYSTTEELEKQHNTIDLQNKKLSEMKEEYSEIVDAVGSTDDSAVQLEKDIASLTIEIENSTKKLRQSTIENKYSQQFEDIELAIAKFNKTNNGLNSELLTQQKIIDAQYEKLFTMKHEYEELAKVFGENSDAAKQLKSDMASLYDEIENNSDDLKQKGIDNIDDFTAKIKDALKEKYTQQQQDFEDALNADIEALDQWKEDSIKRIDDVYDAKIKGIEAQVEAEERAATDAEELANINSLQESIDYEHDEYNKQQLQKQLDTAIADRNKRLHEIEIEEQKVALEQERQAQLDNLDVVYAAQKANLDERLQSIKSFYEKMLDGAHLQAEAEKIIIENTQDEIVELLKNYSSDYEDAGRTLGQKLYDGFAEKISGIADMINSITAQINAARDEAIQVAKDSIVSGSESVTAPTYPGTPRQASGFQNQTIVNNFTYNSPTKLTPSEQNRETSNMMTRAMFAIS